MRRRTFSLLAALALAGCGGSHHGGSSPSASQSYASGVKSLGSAFTGSGDRTASLKSAQSAFDRAYAKNPSDPRNAMGYALSTAALDATALSDALTSKSTARRLSAFGGLGARLGAKGTNLAALLPALAARPASRADGDALASLQADLRKIVDRLTTARVDALETNPVILSTDEEDGVAVKIGTVEGYALRSAAEAALGLVDGALAYHTDEGSYDPDAAFLTRFATQAAAGTAITPAQYLPGGDYGTPTAQAGTLLADLKVEWTGTADDGATALARLDARTGTGWLTDLSPLSDDDKASLSSSLALLKASLAGPTSVPVVLPDGTATTLTVNLAAVLASPPADVRAFYPTIRPVPTPPSPDNTTTLLNLVSGSVADPTIGGLVPGGLPTPILYGRTLNVDADTTQGEVATWASPLSALSG